jgi:hypothetical protein
MTFAVIHTEFQEAGASGLGESQRTIAVARAGCPRHDKKAAGLKARRYKCQRRVFSNCVIAGGIIRVR